MENADKDMSIPKILILGAGFAGLTLVTELESLAEAGKAHVTLVDKNLRFSMGFSMQWVMMDRRKPEEGERPYSSLKAKHVKFVQDEIVAIDKENQIVRTKSHSLDYDYLVIALGAELSPELITGLAENAYNLCDLQSVMQLKEAVKTITAGTIAIMIASTPFKCPPSPYEYALLIDDILRKRNVRNKIHLVVTSPEPQPMPVAGKAAGDFVKSLLAEKGIEYLPLHKPKAVTGKKVVYENGFEIAYDLLCAMPPHCAPKVARDSGLTDASGFIPVELASFATAIRNIYAVGDVASIKLPNGNPHPKAGVFAEAQAQTVARNIKAEILGLQKEEYAGVGICYIDTGEEKAAPVEISLLGHDGPKAVLSEPSPEGLKGKRTFEAERLQKWFEG